MHDYNYLATLYETIGPRYIIGNGRRRDESKKRKELPTYGNLF